MRLDKINPNEKKKSKKGIIIGISTVAVLTFCGIFGWSLFKYADGDLLKMAQTLVSGPALQRALEENRKTSTQGESNEEQDSSSKEDTNNDNEDDSMVDVDPNLPEDVVLQLETYLADLGFGYKKGNTLIGYIKYEDITEDYEFPGDENGNQIKAEELWAMCTNKDLNEKPEYISEKVIQEDYEFTFTEEYISAQHGIIIPGYSEEQFIKDQERIKENLKKYEKWVRMEK